jgi:predicted dehydrogenase
MTQGPLRIGVIGVGFIGELHARLAAELPCTRLVAVADPGAGHGEALAARLGVDWHAHAEQLLARQDIDAVTIASPDSQHVGPALAAAAAGKHILLEKPMAEDGEGARTIGDAVEAAGVRLMVGHVLQHDPRYAQVEAAAAAGRLGQPITLRAKRNGPRELARRIGLSTSILHYLGVHDVDMVQAVADARILRVQARSVQRLDNAGEDAVYALAELEGGAIASFDWSWAWPDGMPNGYHAHLEVVGTEGAALIEVRDQGLWLVDEAGVKMPDAHLWPEVNGRITGILRDEALHFAQAVLEGRPFVHDWRDALDAVLVLDAIKASLTSGLPETVRR